MRVEPIASALWARESERWARTVVTSLPSRLSHHTCANLKPQGSRKPRLEGRPRSTASRPGPPAVAMLLSDVGDCTCHVIFITSWADMPCLPHSIVRLNHLSERRGKKRKILHQNYVLRSGMSTNKWGVGLARAFQRTNKNRISMCAILDIPLFVKLRTRISA